MGLGFSKEEEESEISTPHFEKYANLKTLNNDPRSPGGDPEGITRTPIVVQNQLVDPRSPLDTMTRTPVFAIPEPVSPFVRYKMDNHGFQDSPLSTGVDKLGRVDKSDLHIDDTEDDDVDSKVETKSDDLDEEEIVCELALTSEFDNIGLEDKESTLAVDSSPLSTKDRTALIRNKDKKSRHRTGQGKNKNSLLKQALFKPYVDENQQEVKSNLPNQADRRKPLNVKSTNMVFCNENFLKSAEKSTKSSSPSQSRKSKCTRRLPMGDALLDKENVSVH